MRSDDELQWGIYYRDLFVPVPDDLPANKYDDWAASVRTGIDVALESTE